MPTWGGLSVPLMTGSEMICLYLQSIEIKEIETIV